MGALFRRDASGAAGPRGGHSTPPASGRPPIGGDPAVRGGKHHCPVTALGTTHPADTAVECKRSVTGDHREIAKLRQRQGLHSDDRRWPQSERCPLSAVLGACDRSNTRDGRGFYLFGEVVARTRLRSARDGASQGSSTTGRPIRSTSRVGRATRLRIPVQGWIGRQPSPTEAREREFWVPRVWSLRARRFARESRRRTTVHRVMRPREEAWRAIRNVDREKWFSEVSSVLKPSRGGRGESPPNP